ncbi:uncharacterized protein J8A68_005500 [[Candida] subhashii]|uniref:Uncharacterized protein n=1 Tax=[Candida] subhashii TaxID=561895 RepID=A0A8J5USW1_9ASCO|nr:uncharacterized protein J8A68_005500 [[Candida] subhashii]KAG7660980.1 hypothetical protein J8A68_005500 [[Candida] subhashii]
MFRQRYNKRRTTTRKRIRTKPTKKELKEKRLPPRSQNDYTTNLSKIGTSTTDLSFIDSSLSIPTYPWTTLIPSTNSRPKLKLARPGNKIPTLKQLCAQELAANSHQIDSDYLDLAPWESCWKLVWQFILIQGTDSIEVYTTFAEKFSTPSNQEFKSHTTIHQPTNFQLLKAKTIDLFRIPNARNHRIENLFKNISISDIISHLSSRHRFNPLLVLDISLSTSLKPDDYFMLFNLPNLISINLSNHSMVDDNFLYNLSSSIRNQGKLNSLMIIKINNCPRITRKGIQYLLDLSRDKPGCSLSCIETDILVSSINQGSYVSDTGWLKLDKSTREAQLVNRLPMGEFNGHETSIPRIGELLAEKIYETNVLDLMIYGENYMNSMHNDPIVKDEMLIKIWKARLALRNRVSGGYTYILNKNYKPSVSPQLQRSSIKREIKQEEPEIIEIQPPSETTEDTQPRKRKKTIKTNAKNFFGL